MAQKEKGKSLASSFQFLRVQSTREGNRTAFLEVDIKKRLRCRKFHFLKLHLTLAEELRETKRKKAFVNCTVLYKEYKVTFTPTPTPVSFSFQSPPAFSKVFTMYPCCYVLLWGTTCLGWPWLLLWTLSVLEWQACATTPSSYTRILKAVNKEQVPLLYLIWTKSTFSEKWSGRPNVIAFACNPGTRDTGRGPRPWDPSQERDVPRWSGACLQFPHLEK